MADFFASISERVFDAKKNRRNSVAGKAMYCIVYDRYMNGDSLTRSKEQIIEIDWIMKTLLSNQDKSANFVIPHFGGELEARFVQRTDDYFIIYVSSHSGCNRACRFCHLTQTKQTTMLSTTEDEFLKQIQIVLNHWVSKVKPFAPQDALKKVHVNFMSRGEAALNQVLYNNPRLYSRMRSEIFNNTGISNVSFKISTIAPTGIPEDFARQLYESDSGIEIYYSLYSLNREFRKRWLPKAMDANDVLASFDPDCPLTIHHALIDGENDSIEDLKQIVEALKRSPLFPKLNIVRYNPYSELQGKESSEEKIESYAKFAEDSKVFKRVKVIPRVGMDVFASCGMFVSNEN